MEYICQIKDLKKSYGKSHVLKGVNISIPKGSIYGFVGNNGAGKTTTIRLITGLQYQDSGTITVNGVNNTDKAYNDVRKGFGIIVEMPALYQRLSAIENIEAQMEILGIKDQKKAQELLEFVGLGDTGKKIAANFSLGMRQRLAIAIALCGNPEFLILDEPINGLDPAGIIEVRELLTKINKEKGVTILISSHILDELSRVATYYGFISDGKMVAEMSAEELEASNINSIILHVNTIENADRALDGLVKKYKIDKENKLVIIYDNIAVTDLIHALDKYNIVVNRLIDKEENLEERFFELIGGQKDVQTA